MNQANFLEQLNRCSNAFGPTHFGKERTDMIWTYCNSLDDSQFKRIASQFISNFKHAPLPSDFLKAFYEEKKAEYQKHPERQHEKEVTREIDCFSCYETGWVFVKIVSSEKTIMMFCSCRYGQKEEIQNVGSAVPPWDPKFEIEQRFNRLPFPMKAFVPNSEEREQFFSTGHNDIAERWVKKKIESKKFWKDMYDDFLLQANKKQT